MIKYALPQPSDVLLIVYNAFGQKVRTLVDDKQAPGTYQVVWNGTNDAGETVATGVYFYKIAAADYVRTLKMLFVK
jgi:flagellar hook assembly protein FlgD